MDKIKKIIINKWFIFSFAFLLMFICLLPLKDLILGSMDSKETWNVVKTFFEDDKYASYVMYKGLYAFVPGVICYNIGNLLNINSILLMKIFHSLSFAYITVIGLPYIIEFLFKKKITVWQKYLFIIITMILEYNLFMFISVDFMSLALLLLCINALIKINKETKINKLYYLYLGLIIGVLSCLSGQYSLSALLLAIYAIYITFKKNKKNIRDFILLLELFILGVVISRYLNEVYVLFVVDKLREAGAWIPTGTDWFYTGFTASMGIINHPYTLTDNLGMTMIINENLDQNAVFGGGSLFDIKDMISIIIHYPALFIFRWCERLFLGIMNDPFNYYPSKVLLSPLMTLYFMGTMLYVSLLQFKDNIKTVKDLFSYKILIIIAFILPSIVPSMMGHVENRYYFGIRMLIIAVFCLSSFIPNIIKKIKSLNFKKIMNWKINYSLIMYLIFILLIILFYVALYQSAGPSEGLTYELF